MNLSLTLRILRTAELLPGHQCHAIMLLASIILTRVPMPNHARLYVTWVIAVGAILLVAALAHWSCADPLRFAIYLLLALVAGTLKIRLPQMTGTYSLTFLFVLIGVADLTFAETVM